MESTVTFGKYKGQPISTLLGDTNYLEWLKQQQWFAANPLFNVIIQKQHVDKDEPTPQHNGLQNRFLSEDFCTRFVAALFPGDYVSDTLTPEQRQAWGELQGSPSNVFGPHCGQNRKYKYHIVFEDDQWYIQCDTENYYEILECFFAPSWKISLKSFEPAGGGDVHLRIAGVSAGLLWTGYTQQEGRIIYDKSALNSPYDTIPAVKRWGQHDVFIEVKPSLGDDYPCVLRRLKKEKESRCKGINSSRLIHVLFIEHFSSQVTSRDNLKAIFRLDDIWVVFADEVEGSL